MADKDNILKVVVDNGYAQQKIAYYTQKDGAPSIVTMRLPSRAQIGVVSVSLDGELLNSFEINETIWSVGENVPDPESIRGVKYAYSDLNTVLVNNSLICAGFSGANVCLGTSLPVSHYRLASGKVNAELVEKVKNALQTKCVHQGGQEVASIKKHMVYQESVAAAIDYLLSEKDGSPINKIRRAIAIVDIGGNTTDISVMEDLKSIDHQRSGSEKIGVIDVQNDLRNIMMDKFKLEKVQRYMLDEAIRTGTCEIFGEKVDLSEELAIAKKTTTQKIISRVEEKVGDAADLDKVIFVGGGAALLKEVISTYRHGFVPEDPEFANARGMLKHLTFAIG